MKVAKQKTQFNDHFPSHLGQLVNTFFNEYADETSPNPTFFKPSSNITETNEGFELQVSLPGLKKEDIKIELDNNRLVISGERKEQHSEKDNKFHLNEIVYGKFIRKFHLPENVNHEEIDAQFEDGILQLNIKKLEDKKPKLISVR